MSDTPPKTLAIALEYEPGGTPMVTAKGEGLVAQKIIDTAREHGIPIEQKPILAEALSRIELDTPIPVELYKAVAEVIAFVLHGVKN